MAIRVGIILIQICSITITNKKERKKTISTNYYQLHYYQTRLNRRRRRPTQFSRQWKVFGVISFIVPEGG